MSLTESALERFVAHGIRHRSRNQASLTESGISLTESGISLTESASERFIAHGISIGEAYRSLAEYHVAAERDSAHRIRHIADRIRAREAACSQYQWRIVIIDVPLQV